MNRRDFLKLGGAASALLAFPLGPLVKGIDSLAVVELDGITYRGTPDGKVYTSADAGRTWKQLTDFGPKISVFSLTLIPRGRIYARLGFAGRAFGLTWSQADRTWRTN
jgi:hypothetical protein